MYHNFETTKIYLLFSMIGFKMLYFTDFTTCFSFCFTNITVENASKNEWHVIAIFNDT